MKTKYKKRDYGKEIEGFDYDEFMAECPTSLRVASCSIQNTLIDWIWELSMGDRKQVCEITGMTAKLLRKFVKYEGIAADHLLMLYILYKEQYGGEDASI